MSAAELNELNDGQEPEIIPPEATSLDRRRPAAPVTLTDLADRKDDGLAIIEAKNTILTTLRRSSLALTNPQDWVLFRDPDGNVTGFLQDRGCDRVAPMWGIDIGDDISYERIHSPEDNTFAWVCKGSGRCRVTGQAVHAMEGTRYSTEQFVSGLKPIEKEVRVKQAARANLDGGIVRELAGLKSVPEQELAEAWKGSWKKTSMCAKGKGFGSRQEREGGRQVAEKPNVPTPICDECQGPMQYVSGGEKDGRKWEAYWKCPVYRWDSQAKKGNGHSRMSAADWEAVVASQTKADAREPGSEG